MYFAMGSTKEPCKHFSLGLPQSKKKLHLSFRNIKKVGYIFGLLITGRGS